MEKRFNIRVYGILIDEGNILLSRETYQGKFMRKFVGGGLEWGEGITDALKREFMEETSLRIDVHEMVYINEFFQQSAFNKKDQLISMYYRVTCLEPSKLNALISESEGCEEGIYWSTLAELDEKELTWPIDRLVIRRLKSF